MNTEKRQIVVSGLVIQIVRKAIKNLHLGVYPPNGRVRVAAPLAVTDNAVRLAVIGKLGWIKRQQARFAVCRDLAFLHGFQQGALGARRGPVDLVGKHHLGQDRAGPELKFLRIQVEIIDPGHVAGQ